MLFRYVFFRLLGTIPGPILFGLLIDNTCTLHKWEECSEVPGNCLLYDNWTMAYSILALVMTAKSLGIVFFGFAYYFSERSPIKDEPQED
jgi:hypothetical protein